VAVRENPVKAKLGRGEVAFGTMVFEFASPGLPAILATTGADFAIYDMEHTGLSLETVRALMAWSRGSATVPLVRVPAIDPQFMAHALDVGAFGLMVPNVQTREEAESVVQATRYPPRGRRGAAFGFAQDDFQRGPVGPTIEALEARTLLIAQIESVEGLANVEQIAAVDGIDVLWVGHFDLTVSMGIPGAFGDQRFLDAMARVAGAAAGRGLAAGFNVDTVESGREWIARGYRMIAYQADFRLLAGALAAGINGLQAAPTA
jgi:2-dehydro-3-deoxyglucarate aldolase/4-hydroxy-2-oxoheptanedioate aldolase